MYRARNRAQSDVVTTRHWYSVLLWDAGRLDESSAQIERAVTLDPSSSVVREVLGDVLEAQGRFPEAKDAYRRAVTIDLLKPGSYQSLAMLIGVRPEPVDAVPFAQKAMELDLGNPKERCRSRCRSTSILVMMPRRPDSLLWPVNWWPDLLLGPSFVCLPQSLSWRPSRALCTMRSRLLPLSIRVIRGLG